MFLFAVTVVKVFMTLVYLMAILFGEIDRMKWWCYLVMILSIVFIWV